MPTSPQPLTVRPLRFSDLPSDDQLPIPVLIRRTHARQDFYTPGTITKTRARSTGRSVLAAAVGPVVEVSARTASGTETTRMVFAEPADRALFGPSEQERLARVDLAVPAQDGDPEAFEALSEPQWGADVNVRVLVRDGDPDTIAEVIRQAIEAAVAGARVVRSQARPVADLRVNVVEEVPTADYTSTTPVVRAVGVLECETYEFMRASADGTITSQQLPYGASPTVIVGRD